MTESMKRNVVDHEVHGIAQIAVVVHHYDHYMALLSSGVTVTKANNGILTVFLVTDGDEQPDWFYVPPEYETAGVVLRHLGGKKAIRVLLKELKLLRPLLVGMALGVENSGKRYLAGEKFEPLIQQLTCPIYLLKSSPGWVFETSTTAFVPFWDDRNTRFAITNALKLDPQLQLTAGKVIAPSVNAEEKKVCLEEFKNQTKKWSNEPRFMTKLLYSFDENKALLEEAENHDVLLTGAGRGNQLARTLFGDFRSQFIYQSSVPAIILREYQGKTGAALFKGWSFLDRMLPNLSREDRIEAYRQVRRAGRPTRDFYSMIALSSAIAALGLILNSAAVIIGAMLVAPLMSAITGMGMAIIQGDLRFLLLTLRGVIRGSALAMFTGFVFGLINFHGEPTQEILSRTEPSTLDLAVAIISGVAAAYALSRKNVSNSLPGVAIAVALVPPLTTVGVCSSIGYWGLAYGAMKLFLSNMVAIVFASAVVFASLGFRPNIDTTQDHRRLKVFQRSFLASGLLVVVMFSLLITQAVEDVSKASLHDNVEQKLTHYLNELDIKARITDWSIATTRKGGFWINLEMSSPQVIGDEHIAALEGKLEASLDKDVSLDVFVSSIDQIHID